MADIIPITTYIDITVQDAVPLSFADPKKGLIFTTGTFDPDWVRSYSGETAEADVRADFGVNSNADRAATSYFSQSPRPDTLLIGIYTDTIPATAFGGTPDAIEDIALITNGAMTITTSAGTFPMIDLDFSGATSLNDILAILQAAADAQEVPTPIRYGPTGFEIYGAIAFPTDIANLAATAGFLTGGIADALASFQLITNGGFDITIDATPLNILNVILGDTQAVLTGGITPAAPATLTAADYRIKLNINGTDYETGDMDFSTALPTTTAEVVNLIQLGFNSAVIPASVSFNGTSYVITSIAAGAVTIGQAAAPSGGTDLGALLELDVAGSATIAPGIAKVTTLAEVASRLTTAITGGTVVYDSDDNQFILTSDTTGGTSTVGFASAPASGQDLSIPTAWRSALGAVATAGKAAETPDATVDALGLVATATNAHLEVEQTGVLVQTVLDNIFAANSGWMILTATKEFRVQNTVFAAWIEPKGDRIFIATDQATNPSDPDAGGFILNFNTAGYLGSSAIFHSQAFENEYLDAGISGFISALNFSIVNGYQNLTFKTIIGITADSIGDPDGIKALNGNYYATAGAADEAVKDIVYPAFMANGLLVMEKIANISIEKDLQNAGFRVVAETPNVPLSARGAALVKTALENTIENKWKINGYVPPQGGEYEDSAGNVISLPKGYIFNVFTTTQSRADHEFLITGTILKEGSVIKITGTINVQQAT
ncbi:DUF3383 family protein [Candidatus Pacearchaeota archaeon]|nr:DUF3383 family protein [Candidatus Pacearchaeota archaeon]